ncbi:MAG: methyltransferase domain-containing protein [Candidatus Poribacteria bacterium]|nr:methyltransferase domain-containing protein [Candidatus Poribacteria bacterium]
MIYSISTTAGLENIARQEINSLVGDTKQFKIIMRKPQRIVFQYTGSPKDLLSLRTAEQLFLVVQHIPKMTRSRRSLTAISSSLKRFNFANTFDCCRQVGLKIRKRTQFRVMTRMSGFRNFQKRDLQQIIERSLVDRGWQLTRSGSGIDVWAEMHGEDAYISIRLSRPDMAQRSYKQASVPHTLKPTIASSMVRLTQPQSNDIFLDPMCGAGTILLERAFTGRYGYLIGGDISEGALDATRRNFGRQHQPRQFFHWDAHTIPIQTNSVDKIVCNLPIDENYDNNSNLQELYRKVLIEFERVIKSGGKIVLLSMQPSLLNKILKQRKSMKTRQQVGINVNGKRGRIFVIHYY